ncbi:MAG: S49 family peptidase [Nitrospirota bacterium]|nr:S49 family peptidase [Nitrospirota bacterium]
MSAFWKAADAVWAIREDALMTLLDVTRRDNLSPEAVAKKLGRPLNNTFTVTVRNGVAILPVTGPLFRHANLLTQVSGATSYDLLATEFQRAVEDAQVRAIVLDIDSPGGEVNGNAEFADQVFAARGIKPVVAYVSGMAASAAYWIASAASEIVTAETGELGSIGTMGTYVDTLERDKQAGIRKVEVISSQSPDKNRPPTDKRGHALLQQRVDDLASVFVAKVARNRGVSEDTVLSNFGRGDLLVGQAAIDAGLADRFGFLEQLIVELQTKQGGVAMSDTQNTGSETPDFQITAALVRDEYPDVAAVLTQSGHDSGYKEGVTAGEQQARERIATILALPEAEGRDGLAKHIAFATTTDLDGARAMLAASPKGTPPKTDRLAAAMAAVDNPDVGADDEAEIPDNPLLATARSLGLTTDN